jgi:K+-sensing histidine kinase KdpD
LGARGIASGLTRSDAETLFYLGAGPVAAILLGIALIPLREWTSASNLAFAFIILIIVVAEYGGSWAVFATALASSLSLDFFLTQPYLHLTMTAGQDIVAFCGLSACGLAVTVLSSLRCRRIVVRDLEEEGRRHRGRG